VAALIVADPDRLTDGAALADLQEVVTVATHSAAVARVRLARYVIREIRASPDGRDPDDEEVDVAVFLLAVPGGRFTNGHISLPEDRSSRKVDQVLSRFVDYGIVDRRRVGLKTTWQLTNTASRVLGFDEPNADH
jgi:pyruvate/oxaloacetate carboxyltransferase